MQSNSPTAPSTEKNEDIITKDKNNQRKFTKKLLSFVVQLNDISSKNLNKYLRQFYMWIIKNFG